MQYISTFKKALFATSAIVLACVTMSKVPGGIITGTIKSADGEAEAFANLRWLRLIAEQVQTITASILSLRVKFSLLFLINSNSV